MFNTLFPAVVAHATLLVIALSMGLLVYLHDRKSITNRIFFALSLAVITETFFNFLSFYLGGLNDFAAALICVKLVMVSASFTSVFIFLFVYVFPRREVVFSASQKIIWFVGTTLLSVAGWFTWVDFDFVKSVPRGSMPATIPSLPIMPIWGVITIGGSILSCVYLLMKYRKSSGEERINYLSAVTGMAISFVLLPIVLFVPVALWGDSRANYFSPLVYVPIFYGVGYGILRHKIFNVRLLTTELLVLTAILILFFNIFI
jgi:hypothetical protein